MDDKLMYIELIIYEFTFLGLTERAYFYCRMRDTSIHLKRKIKLLLSHTNQDIVTIA